MKLKLFRKSYKYIKQIENKMLTSTMVDVNIFQMSTCSVAYISNCRKFDAEHEYDNKNDLQSFESLNIRFQNRRFV